MFQKVKKVILFYNPTSGSGVFKNNLDRIIERYQNAGLLVVPIRAGYGHEVIEGQGCCLTEQGEIDYAPGSM